MEKDIYITVTQTGEYLGLTKNQVKDLVSQRKLRAFRACPGDVRYLLSMREVNRLSSAIRKNNSNPVE